MICNYDLSIMTCNYFRNIATTQANVYTYIISLLLGIILKSNVKLSYMLYTE